LKILVIYYLWEVRTRNTIIEHLKCFENYSNHDVYYLNAALNIPNWTLKPTFDLIVYHYTVCGLKWTNPEINLFSSTTKKLAKLKGYKIAIPQDEYVSNVWVCKFFKEQGIKSIYTCFKKKDYEKAYPMALTGIDHIETVLPGYLDENALKKWGKVLRCHKNRTIDIGYRARKNFYWLGYLAVLKWKISEVFLEYNHQLKVDISNDPKDVFNGDSWYEFLLNCRCVLGVESGSSLLDFDGSLRSKVEKYQKQNPEASFEECEAIHFPGMDGNIDLATVSPRHFEATLTKTCQILIEGEYAGVFQPNVHYIPVKRDFSNMDEVILKIKNYEYCEEIAQNAFEHITKNDKFTYRGFVNQILEGTTPRFAIQDHTDSFYYRLYSFYDKYPYLFKPFEFYFLKLKGYLKILIINLGLAKYLIRGWNK
jgi:hypothetical protein